MPYSLKMFDPQNIHKNFNFEVPNISREYGVYTHKIFPEFLALFLLEK